MKTKTAIFLILAHWGCSFCVCAQQATLARNLQVTIVSTDHFEESRVELLRLTDSINGSLVSMKEVKDGSKPMTFYLEFLSDDIGYRIIDERLSSLGHIAFKEAETYDCSAMLDTMGISTNLSMANEQYQALDRRLINLKPESEEYLEVIKMMMEIRAQITDFEQIIRDAKLMGLYHNRIIIHLGS